MEARPRLRREQVLGYRARVQDLVSPVARLEDVAVLDVGVQDILRGAALAALAARTTVAPTHVATGLDGDGPLALAMTVRGAPHAVRAADLGAHRAALRHPDPDAEEAVRDVAVTMRAVVDGPVSRPDLSAALNDRVPDRLRGWCERCGSRHVWEWLFRRAALRAELVLDPAATSPVVFLPRDMADALAPDDALDRLLRAMVRLVGVARPADVAAWLGHQVGEIRPAWRRIEPELQEVEVDGERRRWVRAQDVDAVTGSAPDGAVRLLPPLDPFLLGDRALVVPDAERRRQVWTAVRQPGVVMEAGEVVGTWRQRRDGDRLQVRLRPFGRATAALRRAAADQASTVAAAQGAGGADLVDDPV